MKTSLYHDKCGNIGTDQISLNYIIKICALYCVIEIKWCREGRCTCGWKETAHSPSANFGPTDSSPCGSMPNTWEPAVFSYWRGFNQEPFGEEVIYNKPQNNFTSKSPVSPYHSDYMQQRWWPADHLTMIKVNAPGEKVSLRVSGSRENKTQDSGTSPKKSPWLL